ncbi:MAG: hypothetical protein J6S38_08440 [Erysipelotrichaceae bacterium]|nr:hypothetical protein [Erysipelotrichaceae bacterium]
MINILGQIKKGKSEKIESFESIWLRTSGMRFTDEHEILMKEDKAEVSHYRIMYREGKDERVLERQALCDKERILKLLNECDLISWDGFQGKHPKWVSDGIMFTLKAIVNSDREIYAQGSENFPKHYREFTDEIKKILKESE